MISANYHTTCICVAEEVYSRDSFMSVCDIAFCISSSIIWLSVVGRREVNSSGVIQLCTDGKKLFKNWILHSLIFYPLGLAHGEMKKYKRFVIFGLLLLKYCFTSWRRPRDNRHATYGRARVDAGLEGSNSKAAYNCICMTSATWGARTTKSASIYDNFMYFSSPQKWTGGWTWCKRFSKAPLPSRTFLRQRICNKLTSELRFVKFRANTCSWS